MSRKSSLVVRPFTGCRDNSRRLSSYSVSTVYPLSNHSLVIFCPLTTYFYFLHFDYSFILVYKEDAPKA